MKTTSLFNPSEVIERAQREIVCALLRLLPSDGTPVKLNKMFHFMNRNSLLPDGFLLKSVRLVEYGHYIELTVKEPDYETLDNTIHDITEVSEESYTEFLKDETVSFLLDVRADDPDRISLLALVYDTANAQLNTK